MDKDLLIGVIVPCVLLMLPPIAKWLRRYFDSDYIKLKANFNEALNTIEAYQALEQNYNAELIKHSGATRKKVVRAITEKQIGRKICTKFFPSKIAWYKDRF